MQPDAASPGADAADIVARDDVAEPPWDALRPPTPCAMPLAGDAPFGASLMASAPLQPRSSSDPRFRLAISERFTVYFPAGRRAGAPFLLAHDVIWPRPGQHTTMGVLDPDLGATAAWDPASFPPCGRTLAGQLAGPAGGITSFVQLNRAIGDSPQCYDGPMQFCPEGPPPAATLALPGVRRVVPGSVIWLAPSAPLAADTGVPRATRVGGGALDAVAEVRDGAIRLEVRAGLPVGAGFTIDPTGVRDVIGRAFTLEAGSMIVPLSTTAVVTDRTFASAPPSGAAVTSGEPFVTMGGALRFAPVNPGNPYAALVALGDPGAARRVRVRVRRSCLTSQADARIALNVVDAEGARAELTLPCEGMPSMTRLEAVVTAPGPGPLWLAAHAEPAPDMPQTLPTGLLDTIDLDEVVFE